VCFPRFAIGKNVPDPKTGGRTMDVLSDLRALRCTCGRRLTYCRNRYKSDVSSGMVAASASKTVLGHAVLIPCLDGIGSRLNDPVET
jgi:hypothetical protein